LIHQRLVSQSQDGYAVLSLNEASWQILKNERSFLLARPQASAAQPNTAQPNTGTRSTSDGEALYQRLRALRKQLADAQGLPPYVIFHDATLREMAMRRPQTLSQFADIRGVGSGKLQRYGQQFIAALAAPDA
jgi:ATP-dependent DNA helicase RecQ